MQPSLLSWLRHSPMTDLGGLDVCHVLPSDAASLVHVVQGLLLHGGWLHLYGGAAAFPEVSRETRPVAERLMRLAGRDDLGLAPRSPAAREIGTCRDYALLLCSFFRTTGTPARVRCGFASYFGPGWEDHWVCERWDAQQGRWLLSDAQLDKVISQACGVTFDPANVPRKAFLTAGEAWHDVRSEVRDPDDFGHGDEGRGIWFLGVNVMRDALALGDRLTSPWDRWREAPAQSRMVTGSEAIRLDSIAHRPEELVGEPVPPWLTARLPSMRKS